MLHCNINILIVLLIKEKKMEQMTQIKEAMEKNVDYVYQMLNSLGKVTKMNWDDAVEKVPALSEFKQVAEYNVNVFNNLLSMYKDNAKNILNIFNKK